MLVAGIRVLGGRPLLARQIVTSGGLCNAAATVNFDNDTQDTLVDSLVKQGLVQSPRVEAVLRALDRRDFTFTHMGIPAHVSYRDSQVPIGQGQTISAPSLHAICLELVATHVVPGAVVLDVGAGSGYLTGCLSLLAGSEGRVVALERHERLVEQAWRGLIRGLVPIVGDVRRSQGAGGGVTGGTLGLNPFRVHNIELFHGNVLDEAALAGVSAGGRFDVIHVGATAREVPASLTALLQPGGRLVLPVGPPVGMQSLTVVDKAADGSLSCRQVRDIKLSPLAPPNAEKPL
ncbi:hypothetical protein Vretimale_4218 [Volvox reticuliferus]|uniref:protein-L-isoaspartate(D-aspartate) O-methyltransferase n=1 Tax=Volvox reticuliferus TaxID=1737510 RepID=A0A8J4DAE1_9CHLO|nr:hypothetical protein Vretifemale_2696 [Volvox reticuliferus]GIL98884.1 hypothetical protein Vretimale_4218 [Volvox reticuliferus]